MDQKCASVSSVLYIRRLMIHRERVGMVAKKEFLALAVILVGVSGCCRKCGESVCKKESKKVSKKAPKKNAQMPQAGKELAHNDIFMDDAELDELIARAKLADTAMASGDAKSEDMIESTSDLTAEELAWLDEYALDNDDDLGWESVVPSAEKNLKTVYFGFNKFGLANEQGDGVEQNAEQITSALDEADSRGENLKVVVEAHSCHAAGDPVYNLALSQKRAAFVADKLKEAGVPSDRLQVVGRGQDMPAVVDGKTVSGSREEQWLNRRADFYLVNA